MRRQASGILAAVAVAALTVAACGGGAGQASPRVATAVCPVKSPRLAAPARQASRGGLVPPGAVIASVCQYDPGLPPSKASAAPVRRIVLRGRAAAGLGAVINSASAVTAHAARCAGSAGLLPFSQVLIFRYRSAAPAAVTVAHTDCSLAVVTADGRSGVLSGQIQADLFAYTTVTGQARSPRTPGLIGLSAAAALAAARRHHVGLTFDGAAIDRADRLGTVIFQSLPPGARGGGPAGQVGVVLAVQPSPGCTMGQLTLSYLGGKPGAGNDFGTLLVRDTSSRSCTLTGPIRVTGLDAAGQRVTRTVRFPLGGVAVLSPGAGPVTRAGSRGTGGGVAPGELTGVLGLSAEYRDGPANVDRGLCAPLWVVPATWRVAFPGGGALTAANADPADPAKLVPSGGFVTCHGELGRVGPAAVAWP